MISLLQIANYLSHLQHIILTDTSGTWECGAYFQGRWLQWQWPKELVILSIMTKELLSVLQCGIILLIEK